MAIWIVLADSAHARVYAQKARRKALALVHQLDHHASEVRRQDIVSDRPGVMVTSTSPQRRAYAPEIDPKEREAQRFARELGALLDRASARGAFRSLVLFAAPKFLGRLRGSLSQATLRKIAAAIDEDLVHTPRHKTEQALKRHWAVPDRPFGI